MYRLLIVEDEPVMRQGLIQLLDLDKNGYRLCGEAEHGLEALELINEHNPDVVITDIRMPLMDGLELIKRVNKSGRPIPKFIILSGHSDFEYAQNAIRAGVTDYMLKPVDEDELIVLLRKIAEELGKKEQKQFTDLALKALMGLCDAAEYDSWPDLTGSVWQGPYRFIGISLNEAYHRQYWRQVISVLDAVNQAGTAVTLPSEDGSYLGIVLAGQALREIGDEWSSYVDEINTRLLGCETADALPEPYLYIGEQVDQLQYLRSSYRTAVMAENAAVHADRRFTISNRSVNMNTTNIIGEIEHFIRDHFSEPITLKEMGKANYMHPIYLGQLFKKTTGLHFKDYLHKVRIDAAKKLLRKSEMKVYEIAGQVGYADQDYFIDKFKRLSGMTPTQYREKQMTSLGTD